MPRPPGDPAHQGQDGEPRFTAAAANGGARTKRGQQSASWRLERRQERNRRGRLRGAASHAAALVRLDPPGGPGDHEAQQHRALPFTAWHFSSWHVYLPHSQGHLAERSAGTAA